MNQNGTRKVATDTEKQFAPLSGEVKSEDAAKMAREYARQEVAKINEKKNSTAGGRT